MGDPAVGNNTPDLTSYEKAVGATAFWIAAARALESETSAPLFDDPWARSLSGEMGFSLMAALDGVTVADLRPDPYISVRTRFFDGALLAALREGAIEQVVMLAAGLDTRAFRLDLPSATRLFEIDQPEVFRWKEAVLGSLLAAPRCLRRVVNANLQRDWRAPLLAAGFEPESPTAFLAEGLMMYLTPIEVGELLETMTGMAAEGSWLGLDMASQTLLAQRPDRIARLHALGAPFRSGVINPKAYLSTYGWTPQVNLPGGPAANFGRWPRPSAHAYLITARK
jgi:methyltransferase (TIGR00027 family)